MSEQQERERKRILMVRNINFISLSFQKSIVFEESQLTVEVIMMGVSSISMSWSVSGDTVVGSEVVWRAVSGPAGDRGSSDFISATSYTIHDLKKLSVYTVTVTVRTLSSGNFSEPVIAFTGFIAF